MDCFEIIKTDYLTADEQLFIKLDLLFTAMIPKQAGALSSVLILVAIMSAAPAFGQSSMSGMSDQNMRTMTTMSQMSYDVTVGGKHFNMMISSTGKLPTNPQFNEEQKSVSFDVSGISSQDFVHYEIAMPTDLLSGNLTVNLGGIPVKAISEVNDSSTAIHITVPSSFVKSNNIPDSTTLTITGTQAIPEFPIGSPIAVAIAFSALVVVVGRNKFNLGHMLP